MTQGGSISSPSTKVLHCNLKPENAPELASRYLDVSSMPRQEARFPDIRIKVL
jgi:hypothetical protein